MWWIWRRLLKFGSMFCNLQQTGSRSFSSCWEVVDVSSVQCDLWLASSQPHLWNWLNKCVIKPFPHTNGTSPAPSKLHDYPRANHCVKLATTSTDVFGVPLPEQSPAASSIASSSLSQLDCTSTLRHGK